MYLFILLIYLAIIYFVFCFRLIMSNRSLQDKLPTRRTIKTPTFLDTCVLDADHKALEEHLVNNQVQQNDLDRCLLRGLRIVQRKESELSHVAPALTLLLQSGAKCNKHTLLAEKTTPLHIICESPEDHSKLLDLMVKSFQRTIIDTQDIDMCTALIYAVRNTNIDFVKFLIANGADVTIGCDTYTRKTRFVDGIKLLNPIMEAIRIMSAQSGHSSTVIISDIFDLLFDAAVEKNKDHFSRYTAYILCAVAFRNVHSLKKLIKIGAPLNIIDCDEYYVWDLVASEGNVELLKYMIDRGVDKELSDDHRGIMWSVVSSGNIKAVRYLLDIGVAIPTDTPEERTTQCEKCKENILIIQDRNERFYFDPCMRAIRQDKFEIVKLLDKYGSGICKSFTALRCALSRGRKDVISYLLNKYTYPLNIEYITEGSTEITSTLLTEYTEYVTRFKLKIIKLLLDHGADPAKQMCSTTSGNVIMAATYHYENLKVIAQYIRSGVNINFRSWAYKYENVSPFELSILNRRYYVSIMLLISGCSRGVFNNLKLKNKPKLEKLMKEWNVYDNNVIPLQQRCRCVILNHLSPQADLKIQKLPLPPCLIQILRIPELDNYIKLV